ncbi:MAG: methyltransferase domain-containing protein [Melioribacteraceae bacterium]|nr:methyltransferase domain-containing protein [Melioribacteraceae bacterium]MCF8263156.1 methyltransferase domain-containing protein [Melioribacteraceae bacterium]MCF8430386.1 methyltransferase domain-containing protein [Melioribacteraceae bacterium]
MKKKEVVAAGFRENVLCPKCGSYDRERLLYLFLIKKTKLLRQQTKLLHVAPEDKLVGLLNNQNNIDYLTADLLRKNVMVNMDITDIQYPDNSFDAIICNHVLEHVPDDQKAMTELFRVLKPNGWAVLQVPISYKLDETFEDESIVKESDKEIFFGQEDHVRIYAADYFERLQSVGFKLEIFDWRTDLKDFGGEKNLFGLNKNEKIFFVTK